MKNRLFNYLPVLLVLCLITACNNDDDDGAIENKITIDVKSPTNDAVISECATAHFHIDITASVENHEVEIILHPEGDTSDKIIDYDKHAHDKTITFEQDVDLCSYGSDACFHLEVAACLDHDCATKETADVEFCLQ